MMNNGGMLVNSMVFRNASPGVQVRNGLGGGVYILGNGTVFRTVITNNTARVGGGVYVDEAEYNNPAYEESLDDMYRGVLVNTLVSNNTSSSDAERSILISWEGFLPLRWLRTIVRRWLPTKKEIRAV